MTRIPELEHELVAAAARLRSPRRLVRPALRATLAAAAVAAVVALGIVVAADTDRDGGRRTHPAGTHPGAPTMKRADDPEAGIRFNLIGRVLTVTMLPSAPSKTQDRVNGKRIRATCGQGFTGGQGDPRQTSTRLWPAGNMLMRFRFPRDISRIARWCRLEDPVVGHVAFVKLGKALPEPKLSARQKIERIGNRWARLFGAGDAAACQYASQPVCERIACERPGHVPIENCTPPSPAFVNSFRGATVEEIAIRGNRAAARFSNGEAIELFEDVTGYEHASVWWWISKVGGNAGRELFQK